MKNGDLVKKRWGRIDPYQQGALAVVVDTQATASGLLIAGRLMSVVYPGRKPEMYSPAEFEVISEGWSE